MGERRYGPVSGRGRKGLSGECRQFGQQLCVSVNDASARSLPKDTFSIILPLVQNTSKHVPFYSLHFIMSPLGGLALMKRLELHAHVFRSRFDAGGARSLEIVCCVWLDVQF